MLQLGLTPLTMRRLIQCPLFVLVWFNVIISPRQSDVSVLTQSLRCPLYHAQCASPFNGAYIPLLLLSVAHCQT
jgi:hypothetical protein